MNYILFVILYFGIISCAEIPNGIVPNFNGGRIVGGSSMSIENAPYQVSLVYYGYHRCGGSLLNENTVLTAAHCVSYIEVKKLAIRAGTNLVNGKTGVLRNAKSVIVHENYTSYNFDYDVALILLDKKFRQNKKIRYIALAPEDQTINENLKGFITGWGALSESNNIPEQLQGVFVQIVPWEKCNEAFQKFYGITERMICAGHFDEGGVDSCQGDSGGPMVIGLTLSGVTSWGYGCARPGNPGVYASVPALRSWIMRNMNLKKIK